MVTGIYFFDRITNRYRTNKNRIKCSIGISDNTSNLLSYISEKYKSHFIRGVNSSSLVIEHREHLLKFLQSIAPYSHVFKRRISVVIKFLERRMKLGKGYTYTQIDFDYVNLFKKLDCKKTMVGDDVVMIRKNKKDMSCLVLLNNQRLELRLNPICPACGRVMRAKIKKRNYGTYFCICSKNLMMSVG